MNYISKLMALIFILGVTLSAVAQQAKAYPQSKCSMRTLTGTYVMYEKGSSSIVNPVPQSFAPLHFTGAVAPFSNIIHVTFTPYGVGHGYYWIRIGALNAGAEPIPVDVTITEMNEDCTGKLRYFVNLPGVPSATIEERVIVLDGGREFRTVPTSIENGIPTLTWTGEAHRISTSVGPVNSCGPWTAYGDWIMSCENIIVADDPSMAVADAEVFRMSVSWNGNYTGMDFEKFGPSPFEAPVSGKFTVNPDCSFTHTLSVPGVFDTIVSKGVFFNNGTEYYLQATPEPMKAAFCKAKRIY